MFTYSKFLCMTALLLLSAQASDTEDGMLCSYLLKSGTITSSDFNNKKLNKMVKVNANDLFLIKLKIPIDSYERKEIKEKAEAFCSKFGGSSKMMSDAFNAGEEVVPTYLQEKYDKKIPLVSYTATFTINE